MLEVRGMCMSGLDAIDFMERLADVFDDETKTDEFCDEYEKALNRFRYEVKKSVPIKPKTIKVRFTSYSCGNCGFVADPVYKYCPNCGRKIDWNIDI